MPDLAHGESYQSALWLVDINFKGFDVKKYFNNDYAVAMHPKILARLIATNDIHSVGYGEDEFCQMARDKIKKACGLTDSDVHFVVGGTQANAIVISSILRPYQAVVCADTGHIAVNETGAIEATGHKVITLPNHDGKLLLADFDALMQAYQDNPADCHAPMPAMLYISQSTEMGTVYSLEELAKLYQACQDWQVPLFIDGARLGYASDQDSIKQVARLCDVFYIGGTKCGAAFGEAIVINHPAYKAGFRHMIKRQGGLLAKGRLLGIQFDELFSDNLYFEICQSANSYAQQIAQAWQQKGICPIVASPTNQQFFALPKVWLDALSQKYVLADFGRFLGDAKQYNQASVPSDAHLVRICTSWATQKEDVDEFVADILALSIE